MTVVIPPGLPPALVPLSWLLGTWEGSGKLGAGEADAENFVQRASFRADTMPYLQYEARSWLADEHGNRIRPLTIETGFWALERERHRADPGPGLALGGSEPALASADDVEKLRTDAGFPLRVTIAHPDGILELYYGAIDGPRIDIATDAVVRGTNSGQYSASQRVFGLVKGDLLWRWDHIHQGTSVPHASASLQRVEDAPVDPATGDPTEGNP